MRKARNTTWMSCFSINLLISAFIFVLPLQANAYSVFGNLGVFTYGGVTIDRSTGVIGVNTSVSDSASSQGDGGTLAQSSYFADLSSGLLGTYVSGNNPNAAEGLRASASGDSTVTFNDSLTFNIPAGTYASDLYVNANGFVNGVLSAFGCDGSVTLLRCSNVYQTYLFSFGSDVFNTDIPVYAYPDNSPTVISENFTLSTRILTAGTYLTDQTAYASIGASLKGKGTALWLFPSNGDTESSFVADFNNTGGFTSLALPDGVT